MGAVLVRFNESDICYYYTVLQSFRILTTGGLFEHRSIGQGPPIDPTIWVRRIDREEASAQPEGSLYNVLKERTYLGCLKLLTRQERCGIGTS